MINRGIAPDEVSRVLAPLIYVKDRLMPTTVIGFLGSLPHPLNKLAIMHCLPDKRHLLAASLSDAIGVGIVRPGHLPNVERYFWDRVRVSTRCGDTLDGYLYHAESIIRDMKREEEKREFARAIGSGSDRSGNITQLLLLEEISITEVQT